ncbi:type II toxin-antitoxin system death-on-curing family toxin, partial [Miniimonas arenae]|uniref:type II toxin-antitoxin system death-on-curing family toxin n=1 Tax=Miniimonas arenae TaxID=676201 RepID=UPI00319DBF7C
DLSDLTDLLKVGPVRDRGLLDAAAARPGSTWQGEEMYPDLHTKAAVLLESIVRNHALLDGNKRLGWLAVVVFYGLNGCTIDAPDDPAYDLVIAVATGAMPYPEVAATLGAWVRPSD